ncbi:MAG: glycosyltransferase family 4 protein [Cyclobacteriaceae bacterium]
MTILFNLSERLYLGAVATVRTLMLLNSPYPPDIRVQKEADALVQKGAEVHLLCLKRNGELPTEILNGITIHRIKTGTSPVALACWDVIMSISFVHPVFFQQAAKLLASGGYTHIHAHDLPLVGTALRLRKRFQVRVLADLHENYPDALGLWFSLKTNPIARLKNYLFMNAKTWRRWERKAIDEADQVITVVAEMKERIVKQYSVNPDQVSVVQNTEVKSFVSQVADPSVYDELRDRFIVAYTGGIGPHRGVDTVVEGMALLKDLPAIVFVIIGGGNKETISLLHQLIAQHGMQKQVLLLGHQPFHKVFSYMVMANANIIPHKSNPQNDNGLPHKLCQNMMVGRPVIVSTSTPLRRIVETYGCGLVFEAENPADFATKARQMVNDPALCEQLGNAGKKATLDGSFNWESSAEVLWQVYGRNNDAREL